jgi:DNA-binding response OmpR family regulator
MKAWKDATVLIVEDEYLVAMLIQDQLDALGFRNVSHVGNVDKALNFIRENNPDFCLLDVNLDGQTSFGIAAMLKADEVPFAFLTGHGSQFFPEEWRSHPRLSKPFGEAQLGQVVAGLVN